MKDDFFDWLDECPVQWILNKEEDGNREYIFIDNENEEQEE